MRRSMLVLVVVLAGALAAHAGDKRHGVGVGYVLGDFDSENLPERTVSEGFSVFGKVGVTDNWSVFLAYRDMEEDDDDVLSGEENTYWTGTVDGLYMWRPGKKFRPFLRFGLAWVDVEFLGREVGGDSGPGVNIGGGFEVGSPRVAFFFDIDNTLVYLDPFTGVEEEYYGFADLTLGVIVKF